MRIRLLSIIHKLPAWIKAGSLEYTSRLPASFGFEIVDIAAEKRSNNADIARLTEREGEKMLALIKPHHHVIALDIQGSAWSTETLAKQVATWQQEGQPIDLLVGGPEGLAPACLARANTRWSLSALTFPHALVRLLVAEQLYRAHCILHGHPYHR